MCARWIDTCMQIRLFGGDVSRGADPALTGEKQHERGLPFCIELYKRRTFTV